MRLVKRTWVTISDDEEERIRIAPSAGPPEWIEGFIVPVTTVPDDEAHDLERQFQEDVRGPELRAMCGTCRTLEAMFRSGGSTHESCPCECGEATE
jgi:hypothetical protein